MTVSARGGRQDAGSEPSMLLVVATHRREVKTALFLALSAVPTVTIVATATSTAELISYCHAFRPDAAIVEGGLPGRSLRTVVAELGSSNPSMRILLIDESATPDPVLRAMNVNVFTDLDQLLAMLDKQGEETP